MSSSQNLLQLLQSRTIVDCDTMDVEMVKKLGQFVDCTSNQAIAFFELSKPAHADKLQKAIEVSRALSGHFPGATASELAVEVSMVLLQLEISHHISGYVHVQTNPLHSFDTQKMIAGAKRIVHIFEHLDPSFDRKRVCIKIPSTWEGLQACRALEAINIATLATTLFNMEQAALAAEVGCHYIAPYVNELKVHFEPGFTDHNKAQALCIEAQRYYQQFNHTTQVLPASLTSTDEIMQLAGVHHITIAPLLLAELAATPASSLKVASLFDAPDPLGGIRPPFSFVGDEAAFRIAFNRSGNGEGARKLIQAVNIFCDMQLKLEALIERLSK